MKIVKLFFILIWRIWFYAWMFGTILIILPILAIIISKDKWYTTFFNIAHAWGKTMVFVMGFTIKLEQEQPFNPNQRYMLCPNHTSMIDIMLMLAISKQPFVFVGKKELAKIPIFGYIYKRTCILVDRNDKQSRAAVIGEAQQRLQKNLSICIFPEGKVPDDESEVLDVFQNGAFRLALEHQIPIVPISFYDCKKRFSYTFFSGAPGVLRVKIHPFIETHGLEAKHRKQLKDQTRQVLYNSLTSDSSYMNSCKS